MTPQRIQLKRTKGWRMPANTVKVTRPGLFGNPFKVGMTVGPVTIATKAQAVEMFRLWLKEAPIGQTVAEAARRILPGKNLACWCKESPCHADVLLEIANSGAGAANQSAVAGVGGAASLLLKGAES